MAIIHLPNAVMFERKYLPVALGIGTVFLRVRGVSGIQVGRQMLRSVEMVTPVGLFTAVLGVRVTSSGESVGVGSVFGSPVWASCFHPKCRGLGSKRGLPDWLNNLLKNNSGKRNPILVLKLLLSSVIIKLLPSFDCKLSG